MIDSKHVTKGYWYILNLNFPNSGLEFYEVVHVDEKGYVLFLGTTLNSYHKTDPSIFFIAPVPNPIGKPEETIKELKEKLNLPSTAKTSDVFRATLTLARKTLKSLKEKEDE